jgi:hypothetical protein
MSLALAFLLSFAGTAEAEAEAVLDGHSFSGMIGPVENPDLADTLYFDDGHFWSGICTRCGFVPGVYEAEETPDGLRFKGTLESDSRGRFDYEGLVRNDGTIRASITWERRRWYWTSQRELTFIGKSASETNTVSLSDMRQALQSIDPNANPRCARF